MSEQEAKDDIFSVHAVMADIEKLGEDIRTDRATMVVLADKSNQNREALNALKAKKADQTVWVLAGGVFFKKSVSEVNKIIATGKQRSKHSSPLLKQIQKRNPDWLSSRQNSKKSKVEVRRELNFYF